MVNINIIQRNKIQKMNWSKNGKTENRPQNGESRIRGKESIGVL